MKRLLLLIILLTIPSSSFAQICPGNICGKVLALMDGPSIRLAQAGGIDAYLMWDFDPTETSQDSTSAEPKLILVSPNAIAAQAFTYRLFASGPGIVQPISIIPNVTCAANSCRSPLIISLLPITAKGGTFTFRVSREKLPEFHESVFSDPVNFTLDSPLEGTVSIAKDDFNRTGNLGPNWTNQQASPNLVSLANRAYSLLGVTSPPSAFWNANVFSNDQYSKFEWYNGGGGYSAVIVRASGIGMSRNYYAFAPDSFNRWTIYKMINGVLTNLSTSTITWVDGDIAEVRVVGNTISGYRNGTLLGSVNDSSLISGSSGFYVQSNQADNWDGGNIGMQAPSVPINCVVSEWMEWSPWTPFVPQVSPAMETRHQNRTILVQPANGGTPCPFLTTVENRPIAIAPPVKTCNYIPINGTVVQDKPVGTVIETSMQSVTLRGRTAQFLAWKWKVEIDNVSLLYDHIKITCKGIP